MCGPREPWGPASWEALQGQAQLLLEDLRAAVRYTPDRDRDLPALLWRWQRAAPEERPRRLEDLRACIDGRPYPDPYQESRGYTEADVDRCADLLEDFLAGLRAEPAGAAERSRRLLEALEALDRDRGGALLDNWRRQRLARLLQNAAALAGR